jgi:peptidoglycan/LPS O-acetylase OafA/YrhL
MKNINKPNIMAGIEFLRFFSLICVLLWHYQHFAIQNYYLVNFISYNQPFYKFLSILYLNGRFGVYIFWSISGFIFFYKYFSLINKKNISFKNFFYLRFSRLYPLHFATLLLVLILQYFYFYLNNNFFVYQFNSLDYFLLQLFFASNWGILDGYSFNGPIWSVSIEILVYLVFFIISSFFKRGLVISTIIILTLLVLKLFKIHYIFFDCLIFFYAGGFSFIIYKLFINSRYFKLLNILAISFLIISIVFIVNLKLIYHPWFWTVFLVIYTPLVLYLLASIHLSERSLIYNLLRILGNITYSAYLLHFPIQLVIAIAYSFFSASIPIYDYSFFIFFLILVFILSHFSFVLFEEPMKKYLRNKFLVR